MKFRLLLFLWLLPAVIFAQADTIVPALTPRILIGGSVQYGFLWTHRYTMGHLVKKHLPSYELDVIRIPDGKKAWEQPFHYPWTGVAVHVIPLGNPEELGTAIGFYPFINFPLGNKSRMFKANIRFGWGLGYITKTFDPLENHKNVAIGSHMNTCMTLRLNGMLRVNDKNYIELGLGMTHFSNGAAKLPNLGLNIPMVSFGFHHEIYKKPQPFNDFERRYPRDVQIRKILADKRWRINAFVVSGWNDTDPPGGKRYIVMNVLSSMMKQTARKTRWGFGLDVMYSSAVRKKLAADAVFVSVIGNMQPGVKACYEFVLGRISFPVETGVYLYSRYKLSGPVYSRFGTRFLVNDHLMLHATIKTHFARAEYFEFGAGWRF
jgi:hypothetical protein